MSRSREKITGDVILAFVLGWALSACAAIVIHRLASEPHDQPPITNEVTSHCIKCHIAEGVLK